MLRLLEEVCVRVLRERRPGMADLRPQAAGEGYWQRLAEERGIEIDRLRARIAELEDR